MRCLARVRPTPRATLLDLAQNDAGESADGKSSGFHPILCREEEVNGGSLGLVAQFERHVRLLEDGMSYHARNLFGCDSGSGIPIGRAFIGRTGGSLIDIRRLRHRPDQKEGLEVGRHLRLQELPQTRQFGAAVFEAASDGAGDFALAFPADSPGMNFEVEGTRHETVCGVAHCEETVSIPQLVPNPCL